MSKETMEPEETILECSDGIYIAAQRWRCNVPDDATRRVLCIHGWLDNSASFHVLASSSEFQLENTDLVAIDLPGHGKSSHKSKDGPFNVISEYVYYVAEATAQLGWSKFSIVGHSLGAVVGAMFTAAFPEKINKLIMLENIGPRPREGSEIAKHMRTHIQCRLRSYNASSSLSSKATAAYPDLNTAIETRQATAAAFPGKQYISKKSAEILVTRATKFTESGEVFFTHDSRLRWPSLQYLTQEQTDAFYVSLQSSFTCILLAKDGMPYLNEDLERVQNLMKPNAIQTLPGSHHFHMDEDHCDEVTKAIFAFLKEE